MSHKTWTMTEALALVRNLENAFSKLPDGARCHIALGGSVLHKGQSTKDVDILVYPRKKTRDQAWDWAAAARFIENHLGVTLNTFQLPFECNYADDKRVMFATLKNGQRADFFFLS